MGSDSVELVSSVAKGNGLSRRRDTCIICDLPTRDRRDVEELMACGVSDRTVVRMIASKTGVTVDPKVVESHVDHLPARYYTYREIVGNAAREAGVSIDDGADGLTPVGYVRAVMSDAMRTLVNNPGSTNQMMGLTAAKTLMDAEANRDANENIVEWVSKFRRLADAVNTVCSRDQVVRISEIMRGGGDDGSGI